MYMYINVCMYMYVCVYVWGWGRRGGEAEDVETASHVDSNVQRSLTNLELLIFPFLPSNWDYRHTLPTPLSLLVFYFNGLCVCL